MRLTASDHLQALCQRAEDASRTVMSADPDRRAAVAAQSRRESARLSARLDGSPLDDATADAVDAGNVPALRSIPGGGGRAAVGGWAAALKVDRMAPADVAAVEYANLLACFDAEPGLAPALFERPWEVLVALHEVICRGLVAPDAVGRPRRTAQAVHDGAQGMVIYFPAEPQHVEERGAGLARWLAEGAPVEGQDEPVALFVAGAVHEQILEIAPFEAGNGRLARAAARLVLRARGLDPEGTGVAERLLAADSFGYHAEVAATIRRRGELGPWMERYVESAVAGLEEAADALGARPADPPERALSVCADLRAGESLTVAGYARRAGVGPGAGAADLQVLARRGLVRVEPGTRGLRYVRTGVAAGAGRCPPGQG